MTIAWQLMRERAHVASALHVVLTTQRVHAHAQATDIAGGHGQVCDTHHHGRALCMLSHTKAVVNCRITTGGVHARGATQFFGRHTSNLRHCLWRVLWTCDEILPIFEGFQIATLSDEVILHQAFGHDHMCECIDQRDVGAWLQLEVIVGLVVRALHHLRSAWISHDQLGTLTQATLHLRRKYRVSGDWVSTNHEDHIRLHHRIKRLRTGRFTECLLQTIARWRMTNACASIDVVVTEASTYQLLHQIRLFVRAA